MRALACKFTLNIWASMGKTSSGEKAFATKIIFAHINIIEKLAQRSRSPPRKSPDTSWLECFEVLCPDSYSLLLVVKYVVDVFHQILTALIFLFFLFFIFSLELRDNMKVSSGSVEVLVQPNR